MGEALKLAILDRRHLPALPQRGTGVLARKPPLQNPSEQQDVLPEESLLSPTGSSHRPPTHRLPTLDLRIRNFPRPTLNIPRIPPTTRNVPQFPSQRFRFSAGINVLNPVSIDAVRGVRR